jgi:hypothetical protein
MRPRVDDRRVDHTTGERHQVQGLHPTRGSSILALTYRGTVLSTVAASALGSNRGRWQASGQDHGGGTGRQSQTRHVYSRANAGPTPRQLPVRITKRVRQSAVHGRPFP